MDELVNKIMQNTGITIEQSIQAVETVKDYVKEKFPMMAGAVDKLFETETTKNADEDFL